ncbi:MAG: hypothetical protein ACJ8AQ_05455 [Gemmatimonadales bacterium]
MPQRAIQPVEVSYRQGDGPELFLYLPPKNEGPLIEQHVTALPIHIGKQDSFNQAVAIIKGRELHRLFSFCVYRLGGGQHSSHHDVLPHMPVQLGAAAEPILPQMIGVQLHRMSVGNEAVGGILLAPPPFGLLLLEQGHRGREIIEPVGKEVPR